MPAPIRKVEVSTSLQKFVLRADPALKYWMRRNRKLSLSSTWNTSDVSLYVCLFPSNHLMTLLTCFYVTENREKSGSLSSLKGQTSKWASLRKKLGRLNSSSSSSSSEKHQLKALEQQAHQFQQHHKNHQSQQQQQQQQQRPQKSAKVSLEEKRSLLQRAKTLSILPVNRGKEDVVKKPKEIPKPPELFNVGGEMNMIPLELLIDINDLKRPQ